MYEQTVENLRRCAKEDSDCAHCPLFLYRGGIDCYDKLKKDAADAIERLEQEVSALKKEKKEFFVNTGEVLAVLDEVEKSHAKNDG